MTEHGNDTCTGFHIVMTELPSAGYVTPYEYERWFNVSAA